MTLFEKEFIVMKHLSTAKQQQKAQTTYPVLFRPPCPFQYIWFPPFLPPFLPGFAMAGWQGCRDPVYPYLTRCSRSVSFPHEQKTPQQINTLNILLVTCTMLSKGNCSIKTFLARDEFFYLFFTFFLF